MVAEEHDATKPPDPGPEQVQGGRDRGTLTPRAARGDLSRRAGEVHYAPRFRSASRLDPPRKGRGRIRAYASAPSDSMATLRCKPACKAGAPPLASSCPKSDRCTATWLIVPSVSTSTAFQPATVIRMT